MTLLDWIILGVYFALVEWTGLGVTALTLFVLVCAIIVARVLRGERL